MTTVQTIPGSNPGKVFLFSLVSLAMRNGALLSDRALDSYVVTVRIPYKERGRSYTVAKPALTFSHAMVICSDLHSLITMDL